MKQLLRDILIVVIGLLILFMPDRYDYTNAGFDVFLNRGVQQQEELLEDETRTRISQISGSLVASGVSESADGRFTIDWDNGEIIASDLARNRVRLGNLEGLGQYGIRILDRTGTKRFEASSALQYLDIAGKQVTVSSDTSSDDFTDIQDAIDYINDLGGGTVFIRSGTYNVDSDITLYSNITLIGEDDDNTIIDFNGTTNVIQAVGTFANPLTNIHLINLQFKSGHNSTKGAIYLSFVYDSSIEDCYFTDNYNSTSNAGGDIFLNANTCQRLKITRCRSIESGDFINGGGGKLLILENYSEDSLSSGVYGTTSGINTSYIIDNIINNPTDDGIRLDTNSSTNFVLNNQIYSMGGYGIYVSAPFNIINNNYIDGQLGGDNLIEIASLILYTKVTGNTLYRMAETKSGVYVNSNSDGNIIANNVFQGGATSDYGVTISNANCDKNIITSNVFINIQISDISDSGTGTITDNNASF